MNDLIALSGKIQMALEVFAFISIFAAGYAAKTMFNRYTDEQ